ncbi:hypothetical protein GO491_07395 [Flavobacteriaceae bacterium Ap0902]|nr:hypothetical protein [Flavobacteriaceae bacterium Ap0902]
MKLIKNTLVAVDFRESTDNVINNAIVFAKKFQSTLTLVHVLPDKIENEKVGSLVKKAAEDELARLNENLKSEEIETGKPMLKFGNYADRIVFAANEIDANIIIIGAGEKLNKDKYQLGTTANNVMRESSMPVFVIKHNQDLSHIQNVLCPVDFSSESSHALNNAIAVTRIFDANLVILSAYTPFQNNTITRVDHEEVNEQRKVEQELELNRFLENHNLTNINYTKEVVGGDPAIEILKAIEKHQSDILFMGTTGKSGITRILLGSVTEKVTREMPCSFVTSKKEDFLDFELKARDLEEYYNAAEKLYEQGFYQQAISMYNTALELNFSHVPSLKGLANSYEKLGDTEKVSKYRQMIKNVLEQFQNFKIEEEIRKTMNR